MLFSVLCFIIDRDQVPYYSIINKFSIRSTVALIVNIMLREYSFMKQLLQRNNTHPTNIDDPRYPRFKRFRAIRDIISFENSLTSFMCITVILSLYIIILPQHLNIFTQLLLTAALSLTILFSIFWAFNDRKQEEAVLELRRERRMTQREEQREEQRQLELESQPSGFKLIHILRGHSDSITNIVWSPNGLNLASGSYDDTVRLWSSQDGQILNIFRISVHGNISMSPDGLFLATNSHFYAINIWSAQSGKLVTSISEKNDEIISIQWSPDNAIVASLSTTKKRNIRLWNIRLWNVETKQILHILTENERYTSYIAWSPDGLTLASLTASEDNKNNAIHLWDAHTGNLRLILAEELNYATRIAWSFDGCMIASNSEDNTIHIWHLATARCVRTLEGHSDTITSLSFSYDGLFLASKSNDATVMLWRTDTWEKVATLNETVSGGGRGNRLAFHPTTPILATLGEEDTVIRLWNLDVDSLLSNSAAASTISYANAKVVLVGDSSVGKSGLGLVLSGQPFVPTESTHGRRVWTFDRRIVDTDGARKETHETLLWDLAGQSGYRLIHQLHLNEVAVALVVFDARSDTDPFGGVQYWNRALSQARRVQGSYSLPLKKFLVAARADRGGVGVSQERIQSLVEELGFDGYFETSAKEGWQITELQEAIHKSIDWNVIPKVSSTALFQHIKAFLLKEKESGRPLSTSGDLYHAFLQSHNAPPETEELRAQFETCIGRVESTGLIKRLSFGHFVLLQPEFLDAYASALVNAVKDEPDGLGSFDEDRVRKVDFRMPEDERLKNREHEELLMIAMIEDLLRRELALREEPFLVFPSQTTRENPDLPDPEGKAIIFDFEGPVLNVYATLAIRLSHSGTFKKRELWKNAITYKANVGGTCGIFLRNIGEGRGELSLFFDDAASEETRFHFEEFVYIHLQRRALKESLKRRRVFVCEECGFRVPDQLVHIRYGRGFNWLDCPGCNKHRIRLLDREERLIRKPSSFVLEMEQAADKQRDHEAAKSTISGKEATMDFDVFLCHKGIDKPAVKKIGEQLKVEGLLPWLDEWELRPGLPWQRALEHQIEHIKSAAVFVGKDGLGPWQQMELEAFLREFVNRGCPVIPVLLDYAPDKPQLPVFLRGMEWVDFRKSDPEPLERLIWGITGTRRMKP